MKASNISDAVEALKSRNVCQSLAVVVPILKHAQTNAGLKFWVRIGLGMAISALEGYQQENCG